jgi:hypothetical protein
LGRCRDEAIKRVFLISAMPDRFEKAKSAARAPTPFEPKFTNLLRLQELRGRIEKLPVHFAPLFLVRLDKAFDFSRFSCSIVASLADENDGGGVFDLGRIGARGARADSNPRAAKIMATAVGENCCGRCLKPMGSIFSFSASRLNVASE